MSPNDREAIEIQVKNIEFYVQQLRRSIQMTNASIDTDKVRENLNDIVNASELANQYL